jgi:hypothetical protein
MRRLLSSQQRPGRPVVKTNDGKAATSSSLQPLHCIEYVSRAEREGRVPRIVN